MGQVQNGHLYIRYMYRSSPPKNKAEDYKKLTEYIPLLFYCYIHSISSANVSQGWENETWKFLILFVFPFFLWMHSLKTRRCMRILYVPNNFSTREHVPFLVWASVWAMTDELWPGNCLQRRIAFSFVHFRGFCSGILSRACIVSPTTRLLNACIEYKVGQTHRKTRPKKTTLLRNDGRKKTSRLPYICCVHKVCLEVAGR